MQNTQMLLRATRRQASPYFPALTGEQARLARAFHSSFPQYAPTPLAELSALAAQMGLKKPAGQGRIAALWAERLQGAGRFLCHRPAHRRAAGAAAGGDDLRGA